MELKHLFIKPDKPPDQTAPETKRPVRPPVRPAVRPSARVINYLGHGQAMPEEMAATRRADSEPDPQFDQQIQEAFGCVDRPGYMELVAQIDVLTEAIPDSSTRLRAAIRSVEKAHGISLSQIADSVRTHLQALNKERSTFHSAIDEQARVLLSSNQDGIRQREGEVTRVRAEIQRLEAEVTRFQGEIESLRRQVSEVESKKGVVVSRFESAHSYHLERLQAIQTQLETLSVSSG